MLPVANTGCESKAFGNKLRLCCIVASCVGLALFSGLAADAEIQARGAAEVKKIPSFKSQYVVLPRRDKFEMRQKEKDEAKPQGNEHEPREDRVNSDGELGSEHLVAGIGQQPVRAMPTNMRSLVACGLLLLVMLSYVKSLIDSTIPKDKKYYLPSKIVKGRLGSLKRMLTNPFFMYTVLVLVVISGYLQMFAILKAKGYKMTPPEWSLFLSVAGEGFGILWLRQRIREGKHAQGISAKSIAIFAMLYLDTACTFPAMRSQQLDIWACKLLEIVSLVLVADVLYSILVTHRRTYQKELDVVPVTALICVCAVLAFLYQPSRVNMKKTSIAFTFRIYVDTFALVPQVVMMSLQESPVHAPIAHFVAVNAMGRMIDLNLWLSEYKFWQGPLSMSSSGWIVCLVHVVSLLVVADFFYLYVKTYIAKRGFITEVPIPSAIDV